MSDTTSQDTTAHASDATSGDQQSNKNEPAKSAGGDTSAKQPTSTKDTGGSRDATTDQGGEPDQKRSGDGDGTRALKALEKEREARKAADQSVKDMQARLDATEARSQEQMDGIARAFGFKKEDAPPDPEALKRMVAEKDGRIAEVEKDRDQQVQAVTDRLHSAERLLAVMYHAADPALNANVRALWDSKQFEKSVAGLDHEADSFAKDAVAVIKASLEANETYRLNRVAAAADAGIGATGSKQADANVAPGAARLRAGYGANPN